MITEEVDCLPDSLMFFGIKDIKVFTYELVLEEGRASQEFSEILRKNFFNLSVKLPTMFQIESRKVLAYTIQTRFNSHAKFLVPDLSTKSLVCWAFSY